MEYFPDTLKAVQIIQQLGYDIFVVTNQSGVGRGYFSLEAVHVIHRQMQNDLRSHKLSPYKDFAVCPHSPDDSCECRKPSGKMILDLIAKHKIDPANSFMGGDKLIDAEAGKNAGIEGVLIRPHQPSDAYKSYKNLLEFAQFLKSRP
jgi:D-glycero-D-manno-heptose 1,7-bisphosphate phosphatase